MLCNSFLKSINLWTGHIGRCTEVKHFNYIYGGSSTSHCLAYLWNREFGRTIKMMVDSSATSKGSLTDMLPDKDDDGSYTSGGWKR